MTSIILWLLGFFAVLMLICLAVYVLVVRAFYWGDKPGPPKNDRDQS
jgi:hypothetical protein